MNTGTQQVDASLLIHSHSCCEIRLKEVLFFVTPGCLGRAIGGLGGIFQGLKALRAC